MSNFSFSLGIFLNRLSQKVLIREIGGTNHEHNGEMNILRAIKKDNQDKFTVLDIGANVGNWARSALKIDEHVYVYSFEIIPEFYEQLRKNDFGQRFACYNIGLSETNEKVVINVSGKGAGIHKGESKNKNFYKVTCDVVRGDEFISAHIDSKIDFVKIDVDGMEMRVLQGLVGVIDSDRPYIQFEHSDYNYQEGDILKDFFNFFKNKDYELFMVSKNRIHRIEKYMKFHELYMNKNIFVVPKEKRSLINR